MVWPEAVSGSDWKSYRMSLGHYSEWGRPRPQGAKRGTLVGRNPVTFCL